MTLSVRPRRSALYMPGSNARALEKARELAADCMILDLEDAVAPEAKEEARNLIVAAVEKGGYGNREIIIRINSLETEWGEKDAAAVAAAGADAILLPKVETRNQLIKLHEILAENGAPEHLSLWAMAETPRGIIDLDDICAAPHLAAIVMGTSDLAKEMRVAPNGDRIGLLGALNHCLITARAHGLDILDGVHLGIDDDAAFRAACVQGHELGFDGKTLIHPRQIATTNEVFGVSDADAQEAEALLDTWQQARAAGQGVAVHKGKLVEQLHVDEAERILALHQAALNN